MSATIRNAPNGENTNPQDSDAFPVTGSKYIQLLTLSGYVLDNVYDSDIQFTDNTTGNADSDTHGYLPKLPGDSDQILDGSGAWYTLGNADSDNHGLLPALPGDSDKYLDGVGVWGVPPFISSVSDSDVIFTDITTGNASSTKHGFLPKLSNDSDTWLDGKGNWTTPPGGGGGTQYRAMGWSVDSDGGWLFESLGDAPVLLLTDLE